MFHFLTLSLAASSNGDEAFEDVPNVSPRLGSPSSWWSNWWRRRADDEEQDNLDEEGDDDRRRIFCAGDVKTCPGGIQVSRDPFNNCEFDPCPEVQPPPSPVFCSRDVKYCPDGTHVSRDPWNNCEFEPCHDMWMGRRRAEDDVDEEGDQRLQRRLSIRCSPDKKTCPDGSQVSRDPFHWCEFHVCPKFNPAGPRVCASDVKTCPDGSQVSRDPWHMCEHRVCPKHPIVCAADMKTCPNLTTKVSRDPLNNCQFRACPQAPKICSDVMKLCPDGWNYVSRDPWNNCRYEPCPDMWIGRRLSLDDSEDTAAEAPLPNIDTED